MFNWPFSPDISGTLLAVRDDMREVVHGVGRSSATLVSSDVRRGEDDERPVTHEETVPGGDYIPPSQQGPSPTVRAVIISA